MGFILGLILSLVILAMGLCAYTGRWRMWLGHPGLLPRVKAYPALGMLYGGVGLLTGTLLWDVDGDSIPRPLLAVLLVVILGGIWTFLMSLVWLPRFMIPRWVKITENVKEHAG
ncbi:MULTISPECIES: hypothetical protein [Arthrobacter]|uniref:hypothetical protein n=1 Tax=Arthrobacter TaxID=1663 RepID=UPI001D1446A0|nr:MULTISPECIES: hypothetical protein [Arthrobacter]MCC3281144.1 hypothetical protein [Arthrobacter caoxuetaonis]MCC9192681.1 hypothetical protein [Arthrobacter sp. zg-Y916]